MSEDIIISRRVYDDLINAANSLVTVTGNAVATILDGTPYESMLRGPSETLKEILTMVPTAVTWDGTWNEDDVEFTVFRHHAQPDRSGPDAGVKATHRPTGLAVESYMKPSVDRNRESALNGLKRRVERYGESHPIP